MAVVVMDNWL